MILKGLFFPNLDYSHQLHKTYILELSFQEVQEMAERIHVTCFFNSQLRQTEAMINGCVVEEAALVR